MRTGLSFFAGYKRAALAAMTGAAAAAVIGMAVPASAAPAAAAATVTGTEHFQVTTTNGTSSNLALIAYGVFTAPGVDHEGANNTSTFSFGNGAIKIKHDNGTGTQNFNAKTCLIQISAHGKYTVAGGTGRYLGATGHGTYTVNILGIGAKTKSGSCAQTGAPIAWQQQIQATGTITLK
jgi:hypothetical protein